MATTDRSRSRTCGRTLAVFACAATLSGASRIASAQQGYPGKPIRAVAGMRELARRIGLSANQKR